MTATLDEPASWVKAEKFTVAEMALAGGPDVPAGMLSVAVEVPVTCPVVGEKVIVPREVGVAVLPDGAQARL